MGTLGTHARKGRATVRKVASPRVKAQAQAAEENKALTDILRVISTSPGDLQLVFDTILSHARRLCGGSAAVLWQYDGTQLRFAARNGGSKEGEAHLRNHPLALGKYNPTPQAALEKRTVHVLDVFADRKYRPLVPKDSFRSLPNAHTVLAVPLLRQHDLFGVITIWRFEKQLFTRQQVAMIEAFASQAAMAIHNVRLHNEIRAALDQQTATSEILKVISSSPTDVQPVFDTIIRNAVRLGEAEVGHFFRLENGLLHVGAHYNVDPSAEAEFRAAFPQPPSRDSIACRAILDRAVVNTACFDDFSDAARKRIQLLRIQAAVAVPLLHNDVPIGAIAIGRRTPSVFSDSYVTLLKTFADQAVIAIENVHLFNETKEALERQTATAEILKVIAASPSDVQPVFDAIAERAALLCHAKAGFVTRFDGKLIHLAAFHGTAADSVDTIRAMYPIDPASGASIAARVVHSSVPVQVADALADPAYVYKAAAQAAGYRSVLGVPLVREGQIAGVIVVVRAEAGLFPQKQVEVLQTFADQAVIAIENVRLFNETKEALEQQTASADILRVISSSTTDVRPVFEAIAERAATLSEAKFAYVTTFDGELIQLRATYGRGAEEHRAFYPIRPGSGAVSARAVRDRAAVQIPDVLADPSYAHKEAARHQGFRSAVGVPMMREGRVVGAISVTRPEPGLVPEKLVRLLQTFADQAVIAIENVRLFNETKEALEQQTAISDVLRVISNSPTDVKPVLDAVAARAAKICDATDARIVLVEGEHYRFAAGFGDVGVMHEVMPLNRDTPSGRAIVDRAPQHIYDIAARSDFALGREIAGRVGWRTILSIPLLREDRALGTIVLRRKEVRPFSDKQVALLKTFADQAAIAIENVRLFNELRSTNASLREALEQQTATSELLKVIGRSNFDLQPVFATLVENAVRLCGAERGFVFRFDGQLLRYTVGHNVSPELREFFERNPITPGRDSNAGRAAIERRTVHNHDVLSDPEYSYGGARVDPYRTVLAVPMFRADELLGVIVIYRHEVRPFADDQIALMETFADQAAIAIENVRLFNQTKEALERQTATAEILKVISSSPTDVQPVFETIARNAVALCGSVFSTVFRYDGELMHFAAQSNLPPHSVATLRTRYPAPPDASLVGGRAILTGDVVRIEDTDSDPDYDRRFAAEGGWRRNMAVPMLREGKPVGAIVVAWAEPGPIPKDQEDLLRTFADQAVIAIENVRLFNETKEALEQQTAISEVLRVISGSPIDVQPVLDAVAVRAARICDASDARIFLVDGGELRQAAGFGDVPTTVGLGGTLPLTREVVIGRAVIDRTPLHIEDFNALSAEEFPVSRKVQERSGWRTILSVPLLREDRALGVIALRRMQVRPFTGKQIELVKTFADQAAIAIENVRLFNETKEALEQQTATAEILKVISASPRDVQPVFDAVAENAARLCDADRALIFRFEEQRLRIVATHNTPPEFRAFVEQNPIPLGRGSSVGRAASERRTVHIPDVWADPEHNYKGRQVDPHRTVLAVPMLRATERLGVIFIYRHEVRPFADSQIALVETFADQAAIAIENARLFKELQERTEALTKSVDQLTALGEVGQAISSTLDLETVLKTIVSRAVQLTGLDAGAIYEYDEATEQFHLRAAENFSEEVLEVLRSTPIRKGDGAVGGTAVAREPIQVHETQDEGYKSRFRDLIIRTGRRALLAVPLMHEEHIVGALAVHRNTPGPFPAEVVDLLKTFATQSALAIQNARLFREIAEKGRQLEVASHHKSQFLASMSHELRTPLNALLGFNEMILGDVYGEVPGDMKPPLAQMQASGKHLLRLINNVLDLAKIEAGRMELALSDYSVHDTVESVRSALRPLAADKGLELLAAVPDDIPLAYGDAGRITQCLMNLAGNSLKFTKAGKVQISVALDDGRLRYSVADTGIGIPADKIDSLFTEFKQTDATIASEYGGTGLGLSITKKFIEMHGGRIWVESEPGRGSIFSFEIPLRAQEAKAA